ncbi:MAG TPA: CoA transferase [Pseudomonadales bacterium]|jgi:formyl-CoA transferase|nr:formyl-CoA transferase [Gammaproteobacteria bacterium]MDP6024440.1 CoA transferase [Pseudomonadales bacterium]MDP7452289.1 CoA transferase [Arenicellales bacterium]MDP7315666.1 CoA transferase [Pseudomonadales bacterium]MDP7576349.1 CoA transferase [Pseudomonadales bacterium]|tara:strand:- start:2072 stop:3271 length:1200 start_codon:yes stop_codon:yes gene_type:complete
MAALDGLRILDLTQFEAGTSCTQALAWLGADVVKVEEPGQGDPGRSVGFGEDTDNYSAYFCNWNCNKRSVAINLRKPEGKDLILKMLPRFDVFIENYGPDSMERMGLDYESLRAVHPSLIVARIKGFGLSGPHAGYKSYDSVAQAAAGAFSVTGEADGPPINPGSTVGDSGTGIQMGMAILAAYVQRLRTGEGQQIEISMQEAMAYFMRTRIGVFAEWGNVAAPRMGNSQALPPVDLYPCKPFGANDWAFMMPIAAHDWDALCSAIDRPELTLDERMLTPISRLENRDELYEIISDWTKQHTKEEAMTILGEAGVPCSAVMDTHDLFNDPHLIARDFIKKMQLPHHGEVSMLGFAPRLSASEVDMQPAPLLGEHTHAVLADELNLSDAEIVDLESNGVI